VKVWQPGSHLSMQRGAEVDDWSWRRTAHRIATLARLAANYKLRTTLAIVTLLAATLTSLAPPYLAKLALDDGIRADDYRRLVDVVILFVAAGLLNWAASSAQTYFTGWTGERILADLRDKLFRHLQRLSLGFYERNRAGVLISRLTNDVEALDQLVTDGVTSLFQNTLILVGSAAILFALDWKLALADEIVVLSDGRIAARGSHEELIVTSPVYREIYEHGLLERQFADAVESRAAVEEVA